MIHDLAAVKDGFDVDADVCVIGSGAGGATAAAVLARGGLRVVLLEAGAQAHPRDMSRDAPEFMRKFYWEAGLRLLQGSGAWPSMSGRVLGGSTVINSAIVFRLPDEVRQDWITADGLTHLKGDALDRAYDEVLERLCVAPTPDDAQATRNFVTRDVLRRMGLEAKPLPRAVKGCKATGDCLTGCGSGAKQSVDKVYVPEAVAHGARVFTCAEVEKVVIRGSRAEAVEGFVVDPDTFTRVARFRVRAPRIVIAAGAMHTPLILLKSGVTLGGRVGGTFQAHISSFGLGVMDKVIDPWIGATQGYGAFSDRVPGMKFEALWAPTSLIGTEWGGSGPEMYAQLLDHKRALMIPLVYRRKDVVGRVRVRPDGMPHTTLHIPDAAIRPLLSEVKRVVDAMLDEGAEYVYTGVWGVPERVRTKDDSAKLLSPRIKPRDLTMTCNHTFGSCRMSADPRARVVGLDGKVDGLDNVWLADASVFPSPTAVNPQATVMATAMLTAEGIVARA